MISCQMARAAVSDYIDGALDPAQARVLEEHLRACTACPPLYAALVAVCRRLHATRPATAADDTDLGAHMAARVRRGLTLRVVTPHADRADGGGG
jgi:predicted anti-sigma-YlaC factor YlaD